MDTSISKNHAGWSGTIMPCNKLFAGLCFDGSESEKIRICLAKSIFSSPEMHINLYLHDMHREVNTGLQFQEMKF